MKREAEEAERQAALAAAQAQAQQEAAGADRTDTASPAADDRPGQYFINKYFMLSLPHIHTLNALISR